MEKNVKKNVYICVCLGKLNHFAVQQKSIQLYKSTMAVHAC